MTSSARTFIILVAMATLGGCETTVTPRMTAAEFRESVKQDGGTFEAFTADRTFDDVVYSFKKMVPQCMGFLPAPDRRDRRAGGGETEVWTDGSARVSASGDHMELHIQRKIQNPTDRTPQDGVYLLVADAHPVGPGQTEVEIYYREGLKEAATVIQGWASGESFHCPDRSGLF